MIIKYKIGNLLDTKINIILHGCNMQGKFQSGVAGQIREKYKEAYQEYMRAHATKRLILGNVIWAAVKGDSSHLIANCITQEYYGKDGAVYVDYKSIKEALHTVCTIAKFYGDTKIAMPLIGCGLAGGKWQTVEKIIKAEPTDIKCVVYLLEERLPI